ncbi:MAG: LapA family protein [Succinivibrio sp.]|nr:LapA family protein [Succinivibrio sp.]
MFKFWVYFIILILLAVVGLALGSLNDARVMFDFLVAKAEVSVAVVLVCGIVFGVILGIYLSLLMCFKFWRQAHNAKSELKAARKEEKELHRQLDKKSEEQGALQSA